MAYNKRNLYIKVVEIQNIVLIGQRRGDTQKEIFWKEIEPVYHISIATFYNYLAINAKAELERMKRTEQAKLMQLSLEF